MLRIGVDIGGTFTDVTVIDEETGDILSDKVLTTPKDPSRGVLQSIQQVAADLARTSFLVHGTTAGINALIERTGARAGLITTRGFEDVLEIGRGNRTVFFDISYSRPRPLVPRRWRMGVRERLNHLGQVVEALDLDEAVRAVDHLVAEGVESIVVCFLHAFRNPSHERQLRDLIRRRHPQIDVSLSSDVLPEIGEYERVSTTVANGYLRSAIRTYLDNLETALRQLGSTVILRVMQSNGGIMTAAMAKERPVQIIESGPVGGAVAAAYVGKLIGQENIIAFDMGGTTAKANVIRKGVIQTTAEYWPAGYMVNIPVVDIVEVGIGGGSIAAINPEGFLTVGPMSAGAEPGPVCYGRGGMMPTITDANAVLGRVQHLVGGRMSLDCDKALGAIQNKLAGPLKLDPVETAVGVLEIAVAKMADAIRAVTVSRGIDPRDFVLCAFGGAGPMHAALVARELEIPLTLIPPAPGTFSGLGFLCSDFRYDFVQTDLMNTSDPDMVRATAILSELEDKGRHVLQDEGFRSEAMVLRHSLDMRYVGQAHEVNVPVSDHWTDTSLTQANADFHRRHQEQYGHCAPQEQVEIVNFRLTAVGLNPSPAIRYGQRTKRDSLKLHRKVYFKEFGGWIDCPVHDRTALLPQRELSGPLILEEHTSTIVIPADFLAQADEYGNVMLRRKAHA